MKIDLELYKNQSDEELAELCRKKDEQAFRVLMNKYLQSIFNFSRQYTKTTEDAEDITQDTFLKVWKYINLFTKGRLFRPWLYTIARNTALDFIKKKKAISFTDLADADSDTSFADTLSDDEPLPDELFAIANLVDKLEIVMDDIHPEHRAILIMHYREDMTFNEISTIIKKPMNTVKSWHRRALLKLRERLMHHNQ